MTKHLLRKLLVGGGTLVLLCGVLSSCQLNDQSTAMTQAMTSQTTNTDRDLATRDRNLQVVQTFYSLLEAKDIDSWIELWDAKGVQEMPFSPQGFPTRLEGKDAVYRQYSSLPKNYTSMKFPNLVIYPMLDPNLVLAEYRGEIQIAATGKQYNNRYIGLFRLRDGKIVLFKEYFNPTILTESFGSGLGENFNTK